MNKTNKGFHIDQISTDVTLLSFMAAVSIFFNGLLLTKFDSYNLFIKIPISYLIISTLAFLFSSLILANTGQKIIDEKFEKAEKYMLYGYVVSEYMGVYPFILSIPLIINTVTADLYLRIIALCAALGGMALYQFMGFSLLEDHFPKTYKIFSVLTILFGIALFFSQVQEFYFTETSIAFICFLLLVTYLAPRKDFQ